MGTETETEDDSWAPRGLSGALDHQLRLRVNNHRVHLKRKFPPAVAEQLDDDLQSWCDWGYRFGGYKRIRRILDEIKSAPDLPLET